MGRCGHGLPPSYLPADDAVCDEGAVPHGGSRAPGYSLLRAVRELFVGRGRGANRGPAVVSGTRVQAERGCSGGRTPHDNNALAGRPVGSSVPAHSTTRTAVCRVKVVLEDTASPARGQAAMTPESRSPVCGQTCGPLGNSGETKCSPSMWRERVGSQNLDTLLPLTRIHSCAHGNQLEYVWLPPYLRPGRSSSLGLGLWTAVQTRCGA